jgi:4-alpha-glucanotransferase
MHSAHEPGEAIREALAALGIERLVLGIHDQSFPSDASEDIGRGSPYGRGASELLGFLRGFGFNGIQLGPQGDTTLGNPSPYDGAQMSRSPASLALGSLEDGDDADWRALAAGLLAPAVAARPKGPTDRTRHAYAWTTTRGLLAQMYDRFRADRGRYRKLADRLAAFRLTNEAALGADAEYEALSVEHGGDDWRRWPSAIDRDLWCPLPAADDDVGHRRASLHATRANEIERHFFGQFALAEQHRALRAAAGAEAPVRLYGDLQVGFSHRDLWSRRALFRTDYRMGAPPSRTNPAGQAWGYPVLDPGLYKTREGAPGPVLELMVARVDRMLADFDGIRIDHPHGLVCPWVYDGSDSNPDAAVARGARLFCSPDLPDHPQLAPLAIPTRAQLAGDPGIARYADDWVRALDGDQVARYGILFDALMSRVAAAGRQPSDVVCEVLSTLPFPLRRVMERHGLGRFRVTQKADLTRADDVYRSENAAPNDWIMVGNHDTRPIWALAEAWHGTAAESEWAAHLARRLMPREDLRPRLATWLSADPRHLCHGLFAELFASRAKRVSVFFSDLFGIKQTYNRPGVVSEENWSLRLPPDFAAVYRTRRQAGLALDVPLALALACLAARPVHPPLVKRLLAQSDLGARALIETALQT